MYDHLVGKIIKSRNYEYSPFFRGDIYLNPKFQILAVFVDKKFSSGVGISIRAVRCECCGHLGFTKDWENKIDNIYTTDWFVDLDGKELV